MILTTAGNPKEEPAYFEGHSLLYTHLREEVYALQKVNATQWQAEDDIRVTGLKDTEIARLKREIDELNTRRHAHAAAIDTILASVLPQPRPESELHTETIGMIVDRLTILALRAEHMRKHTLREGDESQTALGEVLDNTEDLRVGLTALVDDCLTGRRHFKRYRPHKHYGTRS